MVAKLEDLFFDVQRLVALRHFGHAGEVNEGQVDDGFGEHFHDDGLGVDVFVAPAHAVRVLLDLLPGFVEIVLFTWLVSEFYPISRS